VENLKPIKRQTASQIISWGILFLLLGTATAYALSTVIDIPFAVAAGVGVAMIGIVLTGILVSSSSIKATQYLAQAILHVSSEQSAAPAPDSKSLKASKQFLERLAGYVYDIASKSTPLTSPEAAANKITNVSGSDSILRTSPIPYIITDKDLKITRVSSSALTFLKSERNTVIGMPLYEVLKLQFSSEDTLDNWLGFARKQSVTLGRTWDRVKVEIDEKTIAQIDMAVHFSSADPDGNELSIVLYDRTAKYSQDDQGASFVAMAVHELRTPLTIMRGYIEVFEEELADKLDSEQSEFMRNLSAQALQLTSFVNNIQNVARIESNALDVHMKRENWKTILDQTLNALDIRAKAQHKIIERKIPNDLPDVAVDQMTIGEVINNLVENALKYTHTDTPIVVSAAVNEQGWVETKVVDQGIGIPDSLIGHVFDKFYRSHRSSKSVGGTGLGLFISKSIVDAHGGQIWVKSKEGQGSTFGFTVPTYESVADQIAKSDNGAIERGAHGWIKNHTMYRG